MCSTAMNNHLMRNIADDLCIRYPQVPCERIEAMVASARQRIEASGHHTEYLGALVEHAVKVELHDMAGAPTSPTTSTH